MDPQQQPSENSGAEKNRLSGGWILIVLLGLLAFYLYTSPGSSG